MRHATHAWAISSITLDLRTYLIMRILILTDGETSDKKPILFLRKCAKTHVRQCSISKNFPGVIPGPLLREGRREGKGVGFWEGIRGVVR
jgi:hypothetical protein